MKAQSWFTSRNPTLEKIEILRSKFPEIEDESFFEFYRSFAQAEADLGRFVELKHNSIDYVIFETLEELLHRNENDEFHNMYPEILIFAGDGASHLIGYDLRPNIHKSIILVPRDNEEYFSVVDVLASSMNQLLDKLGHPDKIKFG